MKIAFEINDKGFSNVDLSSPEKGNPGVGGTWYEFALVAYSLIKYGKNNNDIIIYHYNNNIYPTETRVISVESEDELLNNAKKNGVDLLVYRTNKTSEWYNLVDKYKVKCLAWTHTFLEYWERKCIEKSKYICKMICVGREHYDCYIDEKIIWKTDYIYNMVCNNDKYIRHDISTKNVTFIGSIIPSKGFHVLAKCWKSIVKKVPGAHLNVIGSGALYDQNSKMGRYGIADAKYENRFIRYLTDDEGNILDSVSFLGVVGNDKSIIIRDTCVGVVNPTTETETFCISAVEFEECGVPVCSGRKRGLLDTVKHNKTGLLSLTRFGLENNIVKLLTNKSLNKKLGANAIRHSKSFSPVRIVKQWEKVFEDIEHKKTSKYHEPKGNYFNDCKWLRMISRFVRFDLKLSFLPSVSQYVFIAKKVYRLLIK